MDKTQALNQIISYGIKNKKKKSEIMSAMLESGQFDIATAATSLKTLSDMDVFDYEMDQAKLNTNPGGPKITAGTAQELGDSRAAEDMLESLEKSINTTEGKKAFTPITGNLRSYNPWDTGVQSIQSQINATKQIVGKYLEGGVLRLEDEKKYEKILPKVGNTQEVAQQKINQVRQLIKEKYGSQTQTLGQAGYDISGFPQEKDLDQPDDDLAAFNSAMQFAQQNPTDPKAQKFVEMVRTGKIDPTTGRLVEPQQNAPQPTTETQNNTQRPGQSTTEKIGEGLGGFFGGQQWGKAIGEVIGTQMAKHGKSGEQFKKNIEEIERKFQEKKIDQETRDRLLNGLEASAKEAFGYKGPKFTQLAADAALMALSVAGGAELKGATVATTAAKSAAWGAGQAALSDTAEGKDITNKEDAREMVIDTLIGGAAGAVIGGAAKVAKPAWRAIVGKNDAAEALGEILQGKTNDLKPGQRALAIIDRKGVKTFEDLKGKLDDSISLLGRKVDEILGVDQTRTALDNLVTVSKTMGGQEIRTNYVEKALNHLDELYTKIGDDVQAGNMKELIQKAKQEGLTRGEVNQIARQYGMEFGDKAFGKLGDPLTSINSQMYETTRKGLKTIARQGVDGEEARKLDGLLSDSISTRELVKKNVEAVNRLEQRAEKMGLGRKLVRGVFRVVDTLSFGGTRALRESLIQSNVGKKTMNYLDIEEKLSKNLKLVQTALKAETPGKLETAIRQMNRSAFNSMKGKGGLNLQDVSGDITKDPAITKVVKDLGYRDTFQDFMRGMRVHYPELFEKYDTDKLLEIYKKSPEIMGKEMGADKASLIIPKK